ARLLKAGPAAEFVFEHVACCLSHPGYTVNVSPTDGATGNGKRIANAPALVKLFTGPDTPLFTPDVNVSTPSLKYPVGCVIAEATKCAASPTLVSVPLTVKFAFSSAHPASY